MDVIKSDVHLNFEKNDQFFTKFGVNITPSNQLMCYFS